MTTNSQHPRAVREGIHYQGPTEVVAYAMDVSGEGDTPTDVSVDVVAASDDYQTSVRDAVMVPGAPQVAGSVITIPHLTNLTLNETYRVMVTFTVEGNTLTRFIPVHCR